MMEGLLYESSQWARLREVLERLPVRTARMALLRMRGHTQVEIARAMELSYSSVGRAIAVARRLLEREMPEATLLLYGRSKGWAARLPDVARRLECLEVELGMPAAPGPAGHAAGRPRSAGGVGAGEVPEGTAAAGLARKVGSSWRIPARWRERLTALVGEEGVAAVQGHLTRSEAEVVVLVLEGRSRAQIAEELELSEAAVNMRLVHARKRLTPVCPRLVRWLWWERKRRRPGAEGG